MDIPVGTWLDCGCCGIVFETWKGYQNQDQDRGYGICAECQADAEERVNDIYEGAFAKILAGLKPETRAKLEARVAKEPVLKAVYVNKALEKGWLKWQVA